jgi:hypothetical protein
MIAKGRGLEEHHTNNLQLRHETSVLVVHTYQISKSLNPHPLVLPRAAYATNRLPPAKLTSSQHQLYKPPHTAIMVSSQQGQSKTTVDMKADASLIDERKANLPLPEQPPVASDFNSADARTVNMGSGKEETSEMTTGGAREAKDGLGGIPNDAVARGSKDKAGLSETTK